MRYKTCSYKPAFRFTAKVAESNQAVVLLVRFSFKTCTLLSCIFQLIITDCELFREYRLKLVLRTLIEKETRETYDRKKYHMFCFVF